jgi:hypothetical protein
MSRTIRSFRATGTTGAAKTLVIVFRIGKNPAGDD